MDVFTLQPDGQIKLADLDAYCQFCTDRNCSFDFRDESEKHIFRSLGWVDVSWIFHEPYPDTVHIRLCLARQLATLDRVNQIRDDLYQRLGIPQETQFRQTLIDATRCIELIDDRYCISTGHGDRLPSNESLFNHLGQNKDDGLSEQ